ncbi:MAG: hypothetical protein ABEK04_00780, partial [Candidatus Nanohalobium sp.]
MNLERSDLAVIGAAFAISVLAGVLKAVGVNVPVGPVAMLMLPAGIISIVFVYLAAEQYGGQVARYLYFMALGIGWFLLMTFPHVFWHQAGEPALLGLDASFWYIFYHGGILVSYFFIGYGFYLFY